MSTDNPLLNGKYLSSQNEEPIQPPADPVYIPAQTQNIEHEIVTSPSDPVPATKHESVYVPPATPVVDETPHTDKSNKSLTTGDSSIPRWSEIDRNKVYGIQIAYLNKDGSTGDLEAYFTGDITDWQSKLAVFSSLSKEEFITPEEFAVIVSWMDVTENWHPTYESTLIPEPTAEERLNSALNFHRNFFGEQVQDEDAYRYEPKHLRTYDAGMRSILEG